jgi:hypothetical protein
MKKVFDQPNLITKNIKFKTERSRRKCLIKYLAQRLSPFPHTHPHLEKRRGGGGGNECFNKQI